MEGKQARRLTAAWFGGMIFLITAALVGVVAWRSYIFVSLYRTNAKLVYLAVGILALYWAMTFGLARGHAWARKLTAIVATLSLLNVYFMAVNLASFSPGATPQLIFRLTILGVIIIGIWSLVLLYLVFVAGSSATPPSSPPDEVLNTR